MPVWGRVVAIRHVFRQDGEFDLVRAVFLSVYLQKQARAVKESAFGSQKRAADG